MQTLKGPAIFLAQFAGDEPLFNSYRDRQGCRTWAMWVSRSRPGTGACSIWTGRAERRLLRRGQGHLADLGVEITELSTHLQGQLVAVHPAYDEAFDGFARYRCAAIRASGMGGRSAQEGGQGVAAAGPDRPRDLLRRARRPYVIPGRSVRRD